MKMTIIALVALAVATAPLARAQEEASTPAPDTAAESTPPPSDPSVSVTTEKSPPAAPEKASTPSAAKSSSPGTTKTSSPSKSSSPSASPKSSPSTAVMPTKKSTPEATLKEIENKWEASIMAHDPSVAKAYLADDFRGVSSKGRVMTKANLLAEMKKDTDTYKSTKNGKVDVRMFGGQFAVVTGTSEEEGKAKDGKAFKRGYRWTDVWVDRNGNWQCVASQAILVTK